MIETHKLLGKRRAALLSPSRAAKQILVEGEGGAEAAQASSERLHKIRGATVHRPHLLYHAVSQGIMLGIDGSDGAGYAG